MNAINGRNEARVATETKAERKEGKNRSWWWQFADLWVL